MDCKSHGVLAGSELVGELGDLPSEPFSLTQQLIALDDPRGRRRSDLAEDGQCVDVVVGKSVPRAGGDERGGETLVATSDRDLFQLASPTTTILQPVRGVSEIARIGPAEVRERYGVEPEQVPDFIALRGDPSDRLPGAAGIGPKKAAAILQEHATLEDALAAGRFSAEAEDLRLYRRIAALDASAPLPPLVDQIPSWAEASSLTRSWGLNQLADRFERLA